jgi:serine/threonine protein phosphatase PrpC
MFEQPEDEPVELSRASEALTSPQATGQSVRVEGAGRSDRITSMPYGELYWFEGRRAGFPSPTRWWRFEGAGIVGTAVQPTAAYEAAAASAVDAARQSLSLGFQGPQSGPDMRGAVRVVTKAIRAANQGIRGRAASSDQPVPHTCSLAVAAIQRGVAAVGVVGQGGAYLIRKGMCVPIQQIAQNFSHDADDEDDGVEESGETRAGALLGEDETVSPSLWSLETRSGDLLLLLSGGVHASVGDPDELEDFISECSTLEEACERILVEVKLRRADGANSVVLLGVDLDPTSSLFVDPSRDRLAYYIALRGAEMQGTPGQPQLASGRDLLQLMNSGGLPGNRALGPSSPLPRADDFPAATPMTEPPEPDAQVSEPLPTPTPSRQRAKPEGAPLWRKILNGFLAFLGLAIAAVAIWWTITPRKPPPSLVPPEEPAQTTPSQPTAETQPEPKPVQTPVPPALDAEEEEPAFMIDLKGLGSTLYAGLGMYAPFPVEIVIQSVRSGADGTEEGLVWNELERQVLKPGQSVIFTSEALRGSNFDSASGVTASVRYVDGQLEWAGDEPATVPDGVVASIFAGKVHLADRQRGLFIVLRPLDEGRPEVGVPIEHEAERD